MREIRIATGEDAADVAAIYAPYVRDTAISFELDPPDEREMRRRIVTTLEGTPWLVCAEGGSVLGYAYGARHHERAAYRWSADVTVYVHESARRRGVGDALYRALLPVLVRQGYRRAYAGITLPNPGSVGLHEAHGFRPVGVYTSVGWKLGAWRDVGYWGLALAAADGAPAEPVPFRELRADPEVARALGAASRRAARDSR
jgi:phosphinothricin acetyltransferase